MLMSESPREPPGATEARDAAEGESIPAGATIAKTSPSAVPSESATSLRDRPSAAVAISIFAATLSFATAVMVLRAPEPLSRPILIYDEASIVSQARAYAEAGYPANDVIDRAFAAALERGHVILRRSESVAGGAEFEFRLADFVALPENPRAPGPTEGPLATPLAPKDAARVLEEPLPEEMRDFFEQLPAGPAAPEN